jgi:hypothetical protein
MSINENTITDEDGEFSKGELKVINSMGQKVYSEPRFNKVQEFDLQFLIDGIYQIVVYTPNKTHTKKIVVMR